MANSAEIMVVGAGIFGITAALELKARGHDVVVIDRGPLPHPEAASTDINKAVRVEYGADELYMELGEAAIRGWHEWNQEFGENLYHEVGMMWLTQAPMQPGEYEYESLQLLLKRGHRPIRLDQAEIGRRFPAVNTACYVDGFYNPNEGYAESGCVVKFLIEKAQRIGIPIVDGEQVVELLSQNGHVTGVRCQSGQEYHAPTVLIAAGAWSAVLLPQLWELIVTTGQPVFHFEASNPELFSPPHFAVFAANLMRTGWYGFPLHPHEKVVKVGNHTLSRPRHPSNEDKIVTEAEIASAREFLAAALPALVDAPLVYTRICMYNNTFDENFLITPVPFLEGLFLSTGGSGHGFKFGPVLGGLAADAIEGRDNAFLPRFAWRSRPK